MVGYTAVMDDEPDCVVIIHSVHTMPAAEYNAKVKFIIFFKCELLCLEMLYQQYCTPFIQL